MTIKHLQNSETAKTVLLNDIFEDIATALKLSESKGRPLSVFLKVRIGLVITKITAM